VHRARDDQVKIRNFRIELNNIDNNLSQNPLIRDCKILVQRDRNEESTLVSYIVPELKEWLKARGLEDVEDEGAVIVSVVQNTMILYRYQELLKLSDSD
jgi:L-2-aminoadipate reductase